jgi:hypothetical protein
MADQDPFYEMVPNPKKPGKMKKVKKQIPDYIPEAEANILAKARRRAYKLDFCLFNLFGLRFGWSSVIGIIPAFGDFLDVALAIQLVVWMYNIPGKLPMGTVLHMGVYILLDFLMGLVPIVGDLADASYKCNSKNVRLFEKYLDEKHRPQELKKADEEFAKKNKGKRPRPATVYEDFSDEDSDARINASYEGHHGNVQQPTRAYSPTRRGLPDEEMGIPRQGTRNGRR